MKVLFQLLFLAVFAYSQVAGNTFQCYQCSGDDCKTGMAVVDCYVESPITTLTNANQLNGRAADENYACYTIHYKENDNTKAQRGCAKRKISPNPCDNISAPANVTMVDCILCWEPQCNSSQTIYLSIAAIATAIYMRLFM